MFGIYFYFIILLATEKDSEEPLILLPMGAVKGHSLSVNLWTPWPDIQGSKCLVPSPPLPLRGGLGVQLRPRRG